MIRAARPSRSASCCVNRANSAAWEAMYWLSYAASTATALPTRLVDCFHSTSAVAVAISFAECGTASSPAAAPGLGRSP